MELLRNCVGVVVGLLLAGSAAARTITVEELACLPADANSPVGAQVSTAVDRPAGAVRLYFRRLNPLGAFYYDEMVPTGGGAYRGVLPIPERHDQQPLSDEWWEVLRTRDWMQLPGRDRAWLERWLADQDHEAAELYVAVYDPGGALVERSDVQLVPVRDDPACKPGLTAGERGWAANLTVGETTGLQVGRELFHWLCWGVVTRISPAGVLRADEVCRACIIGAEPAAGADRPAERSSR
jgi:hypothetical protein